MEKAARSRVNYDLSSGNLNLQCGWWGQRREDGSGFLSRCYCHFYGLYLFDTLTGVRTQMRRHISLRK